MSDNEYEVTINAVRDDGVLGEGRIHYVFPDKPKDIGRALMPPITGGLWILRSVVVPDTIIIKLK
jgi:hypothetical protein